MLADMPFVTTDSISRLIAKFEQSRCTRTVASVRDGQAMPTAIFPAGALPSLLALERDRGARTMLADAEPVQAETTERPEEETEKSGFDGQRPERDLLGTQYSGDAGHPALEHRKNEQDWFLMLPSSTLPSAVGGE